MAALGPRREQVFVLLFHFQQLFFASFGFLLFVSSFDLAAAAVAAVTAEVVLYDFISDIKWQLHTHRTCCCVVSHFLDALLP